MLAGLTVTGVFGLLSMRECHCEKKERECTIRKSLWKKSV